ncbi:MAG: hypothetical protein EP315_08175 [Gammaproteobacteria bacterium]|nr:MAG: hypothetical protein EP315_08175 [Gammaproteobacteria bacterium]
MLQLKQLMHKSILAMLGGAIMALSSIALADVAMPEIPKGKGEQCVEPTPEMRKNHMKFMLHQRDLTMHEGIRTKQHSLKECINCHVPENSEVRYGDPKHFCSSCHVYAAVSIDCFQCHADRPGNTPKQSMKPSSFPHYADNSASGDAQ